MKYKLHLTISHKDQDWSITLTRKKLRIGCYKGTWAEWAANSIPEVLEDADSLCPSGIAELAEEQLEVFKVLKENLENLLCHA